MGIANSSQRRKTKQPTFTGQTDSKRENDIAAKRPKLAIIRRY